MRRDSQLFDGVTYVYHTEGSPEGGAFLPEYLGDGSILHSAIQSNLMSFFGWLRNPFQISRFASHRYTATEGEGVVTLRKVWEGSGVSYVDRTIVIDAGTSSYPRVLSTEILGPLIGPDGETEIRETTSFADFREVAPGVMPPFEIDHTVYTDGRCDGPRVRRHYRIQEARLLSDEEIEAIPFGALEPGTIWTIWR
ncbi:MAG: hypothetical protein AB1726_10745 [Planctomycetota bacterium]